MKQLLAVLMLVSYPLNTSSTIRNTIDGTIHYSGKILSGGKPLVLDTIKVVQHYFRQPVKRSNIVVIKTDKNGCYSFRINWNIPSGLFRGTNCNGLDEIDCARLCTLRYNPDSIGFVYHRQEIKVYHACWEAFRSGFSYTTLEINNDINFQ